MAQKGIKKLLVANRSEIACRVFQACREMGIGTVAIYAPGDESARHLTFADEVYSIPSYLDGPAILEVTKKSGATLIHPGYGFLSERAVFAESAEKAGFSFVGPRSETMELMGGKITAKKFIESIGVSTLPWARVEAGGDLKSAADKIGYPMLLKAAAGGGGKGMRLVHQASELSEAAESASAEALSAFGDGTLFLERFVAKPRHIEIQVFGDGTGQGVHLFERECSLQRRHQKIWEEAQAPNLSQATRDGLYESAMKIIQKTKYRSAGTLEFLVDENEKFYFLEMNTRLQVEHPVTELVTGIDLVHAQIRQALEPKASALKDVPAPRGHAIEVRLYAEDPAQGFIPTPGQVTELKWPTGTGIRVESGMEVGQSIQTQFDSMIAKLVVYAENREKAIARMRFALEETVVLGLGTNQNYLRALCDHPAVISGQVSTKFLETEFGNYSPVPTAEELSLFAEIEAQGMGFQSRGAGPSSVATGPVSPWSFFKGGA